MSHLLLSSLSSSHSSCLLFVFPSLSFPFFSSLSPLRVPYSPLFSCPLLFSCLSLPPSSFLSFLCFSYSLFFLLLTLFFFPSPSPFLSVYFLSFPFLSVSYHLKSRFLLLLSSLYLYSDLNCKNLTIPTQCVVNKDDYVIAQILRKYSPLFIFSTNRIGSAHVPWW